MNKKEQELQIKGFIETSFLDWDGKIVAVLFVPGCNFRCPFCHNWDIVENPSKYRSVPLSKIENYLVDKRDFIDGICLTGGEPLLHKNAGLFSFLQKIKEMGFLIKFDTNGTDPEALNDLISSKLIDYVAMDVKGPLDERYNRIVGVKVDMQAIKKSVGILVRGTFPHEFRTTVVPTLLDTWEIEEIAKSLAGARKYVLQQYNPENVWDELFQKIKPYAKEKLQEMQSVCYKCIPDTFLRGI